ncbi:MAG: hypothetical protein NXI20_16610 [bacterium]|nr:hypothetical protein [bacterium]
MLRLIFTFGLGILTLTQAHSQLRKFYSLKEDGSFDTVKLTLEATSSTCFVRTAKNSDPLNIYGNPDLERINPTYKAKIHQNTCNVQLGLEEFETSSLGEGFSFSTMFTSSSTKTNKDYWKIYLTDSKVYDLNMNYGIGDANLDLSGTSVSKIKINTGSANVKAGFMDGLINGVEMDTFYVKVDLGSFDAPKLNLMNASTVIADIGFGSANLDFSGKNTKRCEIKTTVGAGNLDILLPEDDVPIIIYVKDSPLCGIKLTKGFEEVEDNVFVNMSYSEDAENLMIFDVDVALGNVSFHR